MKFFEAMSRKKPLNDMKPTKLAKLLTTFDLTTMGIGSTLGVGVYVLAGNVAKTMAGPAIVISFLIAAIASLLAVLCYAEFGARVPKAGSVYIYCYVTIGEMIAFVIGWTLLLEYSIGGASVVKGLSTNIDSLTDFHKYMRNAMPINVSSLAPFPDFFCFVVTLLFTVAVAVGVRQSSILNNIFTCVNLCVVIFVIVVGSFKADPSNWNVPKKDVGDGFGDGGFAPYGLSGILRGAATCFYAFIGFDCIATAGEEAKNPRKSIPLAIVTAIFVIFLAYFGISTILTMMLPYYKQDAAAPLLHIFKVFNWNWAVYIVSTGAIFGLCASLMGAMFPLPRVIYALASDDLIFEWMGRVSDRFQTPVFGTMFIGTLTALLATFLDLEALVDMMSIGTMLAYSIVAACVLLLRYDIGDEDEKQMDKVPSIISIITYRSPRFHSRLKLPKLV